MYANKSLSKLLEMSVAEDPMLDDPDFSKLSKQLGKIKMTRTGEVEYQTSAWGFLEDPLDRGGPFRFASRDNDVAEDQEYHFFEKYLSMNKVSIDIAGSKDKLFVVRDLDSYLGLQAANATKHVFSMFSEKVIKQMNQGN